MRLPWLFLQMPLALLALICLPVQAQFNLNKIFDTVKKVGETAKTAADGSREFSQDEEIALGEGISSSFLGAAPLHPDDKLQGYVNRVGRWLASQTERSDLPWMFGVLETETINAFALPGGKVFITYGLLVRLNNEAELAAVLAHEIAHVLKKHHLSAIQANAGASVFSTIGKEAASQVIARRGGDTYGLKSQFANAGVELVKDGVFLRPLDRSLEFEADRIAVVVAARAGYDPYGMVSVLQILQGAKSEDAGLSLFKTHPPPSERMDQLEKLGPVVLDRFAAQPQVEGRFRQAIIGNR